MTSDEILHRLTTYVKRQLLNDQGVGLEPTSPLLEWGVLNSMEIIRLLKHIQEDFAVAVPPLRVTGENFKNLESITRLIVALRAERSGDHSQSSSPPSK